MGMYQSDKQTLKKEDTMKRKVVVIFEGDLKGVVKNFKEYCDGLKRMERLFGKEGTTEYKLSVSIEIR